MTDRFPLPEDPVMDARGCLGCDYLVTDEAHQGIGFCELFRALVDPDAPVLRGRFGRCEGKDA